VVVNVHRLRLTAPQDAVGALIDSLGSADDALWPHDRWPPMRFDRPLGAGARGGHGPIGYVVEWYEPGRAIWLRFTSPRGFHGGHGFFAHDLEGGTLLEHRLEMRVSGFARLSWPLLYRPLHGALMEDGLWRASLRLGDARDRPRRSRWVRLLRRLTARLGRSDG
jgi:hypothetical protein